MKKNVSISWDKSIFDGEKRLLPDSNKLHSQIYNLPKEGDSWSLVFEFDDSPRNQGYKSCAKVSFLVDNAPHKILKEGFKFDFLDGPRVVGQCQIFEPQQVNVISEITARIELIEEEKRDLQRFVNSSLKKDFQSGEDSLKEIFKYINDYPYLFKFALTQNDELGLEYLNKYFFKSPVESNAVYRSNLSFFVFQLREVIGKKRYVDFIEDLPENVKSFKDVKQALEEIE